MNKIITVIGLLEKNSGKTFLIKNLIKYFKNTHITIPFKPISGSNYWYHPENTKYAIKNGLLLSKDLRNVISDTDGSLSIPLSILNPVHTLFSTDDTSDLIRRKKKIEQINRSNYWSIDKPILIRYSIWDELKNSEWKVHVTLKNSVPAEIRQLANNCDEEYSINSLIELSKYDNKYSFLSMKSAYNHINNIIQKESKETIVFIESFNNIVPLSDFIKNSNLIIIVGPGSIGIIDSNKFYKAFTYFKKEFLSCDRYLELIKPETVFSIPFDPKQNDWEKIISEINILLKNGN